jgi:hypothetical protein
MMKKVLLFAVSALLLFCSCERLFESPKDKLDRLVSAHWDAWKAEGKDTTMCFIDFAKVVPIEWDTMVFVNYYGGRDSEIIKDYMNNRYWPEKEKYRGYPEESLHFWRNGKVVYEISLWLDSDNEKGVRVYSKNDFIVRDRNNAKLHLEKDGRFYIIRDLSEWNTDSKH